MTSSVAYVGAGYDANPLVRLPCIKHFVFVDSLPNTEFPGSDYQYPNMWTPLTWWNRVLHEFATHGFTPDSDIVPLTKNTRIAFKNGERTLDYWFNTAWPSHNPALLDELRACSHLYLAGFDPHGRLLNDLSRGPIEVYTDFRTVYYPNFGEEASPIRTMSTFNRLHFDTRIMRRVANVWYFAHSGTKYRYNTLDEVAARL